MACNPNRDLENENQEEKFKEFDFTFKIDNFAYLGIKILLTLHIIYSLASNSVRTHPKFHSRRRPLLLFLFLLFLTLLADVLSLVLLTPLATSAFREQSLLYFWFFIPDMCLLAAMTWAVVAYRRVELEALIEMGVFKELDEMNDHEMFMEYDKMIK